MRNNDKSIFHPIIGMTVIICVERVAVPVWEFLPTTTILPPLLSIFCVKKNGYP